MVSTQAGTQVRLEHGSLRTSPLLESSPPTCVGGLYQNSSTGHLPRDMVSPLKCVGLHFPSPLTLRKDLPSGALASFDVTSTSHSALCPKSPICFDSVGTAESSMPRTFEELEATSKSSRPVAMAALQVCYAKHSPIDRAGALSPRVPPLLHLPCFTCRCPPTAAPPTALPPPHLSPVTTDSFSLRRPGESSSL